MNEEDQTLPTLLTIANAIGDMRDEINRRFDETNQRIDQLRFETLHRINDLRQEMTQKITSLELSVNAKLEEMRLQMMRFDVRQDRFESMVHESLAVAYNVRADVTILREEVSSLITEVRLKNNVGVLP